MNNKKITIAIIIVLVIATVSLGIAFATFSTTLNITGTASVESSTWNIVFEGITNPNTLDAPTITGTAEVITAPTIKNNATEISNYEVSLKTPGDSVTYNFKIHNKGDYAARISSIVMNTGVNLTTNTSKRTSEINTLYAMDYKLYYTDNNDRVGTGVPKDCLEPGEYENVTLKLAFSSTDTTYTIVLPSEDLLLDNLGIVVNYTQVSNNSCSPEVAIGQLENGNFYNMDGSYYTYEGKSFIGTGINNIIISENIIGEAELAKGGLTGKCSDGSDLTITENVFGEIDSVCPAGTHELFNSYPAETMAEGYCTGCRLMTNNEAEAWGCPTKFPISTDKCVAKYNGVDSIWWLSDITPCEENFCYGFGYFVFEEGIIASEYSVLNDFGVRPVVSIPSGATITGSGTKSSPYVITVSN